MDITQWINLAQKMELTHRVMSFFIFRPHLLTELAPDSVMLAHPDDRESVKENFGLEIANEYFTWEKVYNSISGQRAFQGPLHKDYALAYHAALRGWKLPAGATPELELVYNSVKEAFSNENINN